MYPTLSEDFRPTSLPELFLEMTKYLFARIFLNEATGHQVSRYSPRTRFFLLFYWGPP